MNNRIKKALLPYVLYILLPCLQCSAHCPPAENDLGSLTSCQESWSILFYLGKMTNDNLGEVATFDFSLNSDTLYSLEIGKELNPCNPFRVYFEPVVSSIDFRTNLTLLKDTYGKLTEFNPYIAVNWCHFPWCKFIKTTLSVGEGVSYVSKVPYTEEHNSDQAKRLLNFLLFEIAFALPRHPQFELIARIHHRSGVFGLYHANNTGSTAVGLALRYWFKR